MSNERSADMVVEKKKAGRGGVWLNEYRFNDIFDRHQVVVVRANAAPTSHLAVMLAPPQPRHVQPPRQLAVGRLFKPANKGPLILQASVATRDHKRYQLPYPHLVVLAPA